MSVDTTFTVRHPYVGEVPIELMTGFEAFSIDSEWQWVLVENGKIKAQMLCANAHGLLIIIRLTSLPDVSKGWLVRMFREVMRDARENGCIGYATFLADDNPKELKLMRIVQKSGGFLLPKSGAWAAGSTEVKY